MQQLFLTVNPFCLFKLQGAVIVILFFIIYADSQRSRPFALSKTELRQLVIVWLFICIASPNIAMACKSSHLAQVIVSFNNRC